MQGNEQSPLCSDGQCGLLFHSLPLRMKFMQEKNQASDATKKVSRSKSVSAKHRAQNFQIFLDKSGVCMIYATKENYHLLTRILSFLLCMKKENIMEECLS